MSKLIEYLLESPLDVKKINAEAIKIHNDAYFTLDKNISPEIGFTREELKEEMKRIIYSDLIEVNLLNKEYYNKINNALAIWQPKDNYQSVLKNIIDVKIITSNLLPDILEQQAIQEQQKIPEQQAIQEQQTIQEQQVIQDQQKILEQQEIQEQQKIQEDKKMKEQQEIQEQQDIKDKIIEILGKLAESLYAGRHDFENLHKLKPQLDKLNSLMTEIVKEQDNIRAMKPDKFDPTNALKLFKDTSSFLKDTNQSIKEAKLSTNIFKRITTWIRDTFNMLRKNYVELSKEKQLERYIKEEKDALKEYKQEAKKIISPKR